MFINKKINHYEILRLSSRESIFSLYIKRGIKISAFYVCTLFLSGLFWLLTFHSSSFHFSTHNSILSEIRTPMNLDIYIIVRFFWVFIGFFLYLIICYLICLVASFIVNKVGEGIGIFLVLSIYTIDVFVTNFSLITKQTFFQLEQLVSLKGLAIDFIYLIAWIAVLLFILFKRIKEANFLE